MKCAILAALVEVVPQFVSSCVKALFENSATARRLRACAESWQKQCSEWKEKFRIAELEIQTLRGKLATAYAGIAVLIITVILCMIFPQMRLLIGSVGLAVVFGSQVLPMTSSLKKYVSQGLHLSTRLWQSASREISLVLGHLVQVVERIHRRIRDWRWKSVPVSRNFNTAP
jgi:hypothetical protein